jgi:hypothetical protein
MCRHRGPGGGVGGVNNLSSRLAGSILERDRSDSHEVVEPLARDDASQFPDLQRQGFGSRSLLRGRRLLGRQRSLDEARQVVRELQACRLVAIYDVPAFVTVVGNAAGKLRCQRGGRGGVAFAHAQGVVSARSHEYLHGLVAPHGIDDPRRIVTSDVGDLVLFARAVRVRLRQAILIVVELLT